MKLGTLRDLAYLEDERIRKNSLVRKGGEGSGHFDHAGRPGEVGGSAPGEGGGEKAKIPAGYAESSKSFGWGRQGKRGTSTASFRFTDEIRGEKFFDSTFSVMQGKAGDILVGSEIRQGGRYGKTVKEMGLDSALKPGTVLAISAGWIGPQGSKSTKSFQIVVNEVIPAEYDQIRVKYTQISPKLKNE